MAALTDAEVEQVLTSLPRWQRQGKAIQRIFEFPDFKAAMQFVNRIADAAERAKSPSRYRYPFNKVTMALVSHDAGGVTQRDIKMARRINGVSGL
jgi:4a-hydroxytetrahydrobiopterin dehydratase